MRAYVLPYRVLFHDTMAYGTHHFLTNLKFQCLAREHYYFAHTLDRSEASRALHDQHVILTRDAYSLNLWPVAVGERVAILMTVEAAGRRTVRMCFRVVHESGRPVCAGYQTLVRLDRQTQALLDTPDEVREAALRIREPLDPNLAERLHQGKVSEVFDARTLALARRALETDLPAEGAELEEEAPAASRIARGPERQVRSIFLFPGQGSCDPAPIRAALAAGGRGAEAVREADAIGRELLGASLVDALGRSEGPGAELQQLGIHLLGTLATASLRARGIAPDAVAGHSLGEISALSAAGALTPAEGAAIVCHRAAVLRELGPIGGMLAVMAPPERVAELIAPLDRLRIAVINHAAAVAVSGPFSALEGLEASARAAGVATRRIRSPHPFHHPLLAPAVAPLRARIEGMGLGTRRLALPVRSAVEGGWLAPEQPDLAGMLSSHLVRPADWPGAVRALADAGGSALWECGGGSVLSGFVRRILDGRSDVTARAVFAGQPPEESERATRTRPALPPAALLPSGAEPIAIVGLGCVVPNASDPESLWEAVLTGRSGLSDAAVHDPELALDFLAGSSRGPVPDKTYTLLGSFVRGFVPAAAPPADGAPSVFRDILSEALAQALGALDGADRALLAVGSTADGSREHDDALLVEALLAEADRLPGAERSALRARLIEVFGSGDPRATAPREVIAAAARRILGPRARAIAVDAACASSLYAIDLGVRALRAGEVDLAFCGGVFAPGPGNAALFSQFGGLSATGSRPLDRRADGVVFGDGAAVVALRRLSDAVARSEHVYATIREVGTSCDGRGPSVTVPQVRGQVMAMRRAWQRAGLDPSRADLIEAHATSTPVGDTVEMKAVREVFAQGRREPLVLGSLKALTGHTGWAAGAASLVKVCRALGARTLPPQANVSEPNTVIASEPSLVVLDAPRPWPTPADGEPRRAGVSGFGFGGSNAHVIVEEHRPGAQPVRPSPTFRRQRVAVVGIGRVQPAEGPRLSEAELALPPGRPVLPDALDELDRSHRAAIRASAAALPEGWEAVREEIGVVLAFAGRSPRGLQAHLRLSRDRVARRLREENGVPSAAVTHLLERLDAIRPTGPYTLPGAMPNVAAGRVANFFDLMGPNLVLDSDSDGLGAALSLAASWLCDGTCQIALAGALSATSEGEPEPEGVLQLALASPQAAAELGLPVLAVLEIGRAVPEGQQPVTVAPGSALAGAGALHDAIAEESPDVWLRWPSVAVRVCAPHRPAADPELEMPPLLLAEPALEPAPLPQTEPAPLPPSRTLVLTETAPLPTALRGATALRPAEGRARPGETVDLTDEDTVAASLASLDPGAFDAIVALRPSPADRLGQDRLVELLFVVARWALAAGRPLRIGTVCAEAVGPDGRMHPSSGTLAGFVKALARERSDTPCRAVTSDAPCDEALSQLCAELAQPPAPSAAEAVYLGGVRHVEVLSERAVASGAGEPVLGPRTVVIATGGGTGVTAALIEASKRTWGHPVALVGRSDPSEAPPELVAMDDDAFAAHETAWYREQRAADPGTPLAALRERFARLSAAREVARTLARLAALPGRVTYHRLDLVDPEAVSAGVRAIAEAHGPPDLVLHGAGVQRSGRIGQQRLEDFRRTLDTKLAGLQFVLDAIASVCPGRPVAVHVLGSMFSLLGNDGQHAYGAANESLHRLARWREGCTGIAWAGWRSLGMTAGSEYALVARTRRLRPLGLDEGRGAFLEAVSRSGGPRLVLPASAAEVAWSGVPLRPQRLASFPASPDAHPFVEHHRLGDQPVIAGAFELELVVRALVDACPGWAAIEATDLRWEQFARTRPQGAFRVEGRTLDASPDRRLVRVRLLSDFVHHSGALLRRDVCHFQATVALIRTEHARPDAAASGTLPWQGPTVRLPSDPYCAPGAPVRLGGPFACVQEIEVGPSGQRAVWRFPDPSVLHRIGHHALPALLADAACRVAMYRAEDPPRTPIPFRCRRCAMAPGSNDLRLQQAFGELEIVAALNRREGDRQASAWSVARDPSSGRTLLRLEGLLARFADGAPESPTHLPGAAPGATTGV